MLTSAVQCNQDQFYLLIATAVGGSIFLVKTGSVLSINQQLNTSAKTSVSSMYSFVMISFLPMDFTTFYDLFFRRAYVGLKLL